MNKTAYQFHSGDISQWEGFEQFNDHDEVSFRNNQPFYYFNSHDYRNTASIQTQSITTQNNTLKKKKYSSSRKNKKQSSFKSSKHATQQISIKIKQDSKTISQVRLRPQILQYKLKIPKKQRIPIYPYLIQRANSIGKCIYQGINPRNSYQLFKYISQCNYKSISLIKSQQFEFNSNFECGNLHSAYWYVNSNNIHEFDLYMKADTNTNGHRQWYYFLIRNKNKNRVKINIYYFQKKYSLYQRGLKPYVKSTKGKRQWEAKGEKVTYKIVDSFADGREKGKYFLSFQYVFQHEYDQVYFAAGIPYSYTYLQQTLTQYQKKFITDQIVYQKCVLCHSLSGLEIPLIKIQPKIKNIDKKKKYLIINARTHPGQTSSSWVMEGIINQILQNESVWQWIKQENIHFQIVPMLNVDGVFSGNYRTGIIGQDFNRNFLTSSECQFPEIHAIRQLVSECKNNGRIQLFLDLHGHSVLRNCFIYGPTISSNSSMQYLPYLLSQTSQYFSINSSRFQTNEAKLETARMYFQIKQNILSYTCENTLGLWSRQNSKLIQQNTQFSNFIKSNTQMFSCDWKKFGRQFLRGIKSLLSIQSQKIIPLLQIVQKQVNKKKLENKQKRKLNKQKQVLELAHKKKEDIKKISNKSDHFKIKQNNRLSPGNLNNDMKNVFCQGIKSKKYGNFLNYKRRLSQLSSLKSEKNCQQKKNNNKLFNSPCNKKQFNFQYIPKNIHLNSSEVSFYEIKRSKTDQPSALQQLIKNQPQCNQYQQSSQLANLTQSVFLQKIQQNMSQDYSPQNSINDSDSQSQSLPIKQKRELFLKVRGIRLKQISKTDKQKIQSKKLTSFKSFKQYIFQQDENQIQNIFRFNQNKNIPNNSFYSMIKNSSNHQFHINRHKMIRRSIKLKNSIQQFGMNIKKLSNPKNNILQKQVQDIEIFKIIPKK